MTLAELMQIWAGPQLMPLPKAQSNVTAGSPPGVPYVHPYQLMAPFTALNSATYENKLKEAQTEEAKRKAEGIAKIDWGDIYAGTSPGGGAATGGIPAPRAAPASAYGSLSPQPMQLGDAEASGPLALIRKYEQGSTPWSGYGDADLSKKPLNASGAPDWEGVRAKTGTTHAFSPYQFQPGTWKGIVDKYFGGFLDWRDTANQDAVARRLYLDQGFAPWAPYNSRLAAAIGYRGGRGPEMSLGADTQSDPGAIPSVPNFAGMMAGNQGPAYAPPAFGSMAPPMQAVQAGPQTDQQARDAAVRRAIERAETSASPAAAGGQLPNKPADYVFGNKIPRPQVDAQGNITAYPPPTDARGNIVDNNGYTPVAPSAFGALAPPMPQLAPGGAQIGGRTLDPGKLARLGMAAKMYGMPDITEPLSKFYYNDPAYKGQVAGAEAGAKAPIEIASKWAMPEASVTLQGQMADIKAKAEAAAAWGKPESSPELQGQITAAREAAQLAREKAMAQFNVDPNAIGGAPAAPVAGQPSAVPGAITAPPRTERGTVIPPITEAAPIVGSPAYLRDRQTGKEGWAGVEGEWFRTLPIGKRAEQRALAVAGALKSYQSGSFAGELSDIRAKLKAVGLELPESVAQDPAKAQQIIKDNFAQMLESIKGFDSNPATYQIRLALENWANPNLQPEANLSIIGSTVGALRWQEAMVQDWSEAKKLGWRDPQDFMRAWAAKPENSVQSFVDKAKEEIGPLKGMSIPGVPAGAKPAGTYKGQPVYQMPDGSLKVMQ